MLSPSLEFLYELPLVKSSEPTISLRRVLLPTPLAPTIAILLSISMAKLTFLRMYLSSEYPK